ncbi:hypothetical protein H6F42_17870 [Pseudanabaena sp. FACHB-1998]|uniref:hypothetical protein n=1 Tax=Pseudanabaena sp. FACHB-1998 TaxID=2692858 RepID=UPI001681A794|nr:hypothetical protein [Pseudanabaena sp. FACHB-1998]MBD2178790.1 hypothetical protein [Pseudanabaena sp. FACHB-1998]
MQITVEIPDDIAQRLEPLKDKLPQILALGLQEITANPTTGFSGLTEVLEFFAKLPSPQEILALRPAPNLQTEIENLLDKNRTEGLNERDRRLWQHYEFVEHLVRIAKAQALLKLQQSA